MSQSGPGITSNKFKYRGGLKKCVMAKFFLKSSDLPSFISFIGIPDVFDVTRVPSVLCLSTKSKTVFLISNFSTTTSIIQSTSLILFISSSKFPNVTLLMNFLLYIGDGFDLIHLLNISFTILFLTSLLSRDKFFFFSDSFSSLGHMSNSKTSTPMFAK